MESKEERTKPQQLGWKTHGYEEYGNREAAAFLTSKRDSERNSIEDCPVHPNLSDTDRVDNVRWYYQKAIVLKPTVQEEVSARGGVARCSQLLRGFRASLKQLAQQETEANGVALYKIRLRRPEPIRGRTVQRMAYGAVSAVPVPDMPSSPVATQAAEGWASLPWTNALLTICETNVLIVEQADMLLWAPPIFFTDGAMVAIDRAGREACRISTLPLTTCELLPAKMKSSSACVESKSVGSNEEISTGTCNCLSMHLETPFLGLELRFHHESDMTRFCAEFSRAKEVATLRAQILRSAVRFLETTWRHYQWRALYANVWALFGPACHTQKLLESSWPPLSIETATERTEALYRAIQARRLRKRLAKACQAARQRGMNVRIEGRCCVGATLVTKAWIQAGWAQIQWLRTPRSPTKDGGDPAVEAITGATNRVYLCSGEDLGKTLIVRWTVRSNRTSAILDEFQIQTKPVFIDRESYEAKLLQRWSLRPRCRVVCVRLERDGCETSAVPTLSESTSYLLYLEAAEAQIHPYETKDQSSATTKTSGACPTESVSTTVTAATALLGIPYRTLYVSSDICTPTSKPLFLVADLARNIYLVLATRTFAERNVAVCVLQQLCQMTTQSERGPDPPAGIARFALQAAAAAERLTARPLDSTQTKKIVQRADADATEREQSSVLDLDVSISSRDSFSGAHDGKVRRDGRSMELARAGWQALGRGIAGFVQSSKSLASRPSFDRWRGLSRWNRHDGTVHHVRSAIEHLSEQYIRGQ